MFKHILVPTDGSPLSQAAVDRAMNLAKEAGAKLTAIHVGEPFHLIAANVEILVDTREEYERYLERRANQLLGPIEQAARQAGVAFERIFRTSGHPYQAIIDAAKETGCDLIVMASHGRRGVQALLLGSETQKVLTHSDIPVLVYR